MADSSVIKPVSQVEHSAKVELGKLVWRFLWSLGLIAGIVAVATMIAHWMRPIA
jgi:hypothetical protein